MKAPALPGLGSPIKGAWTPPVNPFELQTILETAIAHHKAGRAQEAERGYQAVLQRVPNQPDALNLLAVLAVEASNHVAGAELFERALRVRPRDPVILNNSGNALILSRRHEEAIAVLEQALAIDPEMTDAWLNYGKALNLGGRPQDALRAFAELQKRRPESRAVLTGIARAHQELGEIPETERLARQMIAQNTESAAGYVTLAGVRKFKQGDAELDAVLRLLDKPDLAAQERRGLSYAAGKMCDDIGRYDEAFVHYERANALRGLVYDHATLVKDYDALIATHTDKFFRERSGWGVASERPIFIVGMPRSGTTLVETILGAHPQVFAAGELETIKQLQRKTEELVSEPGNPWVSGAKLSWFGVELMAKRYLEALNKRDSVAPRVTDKMPHNFQNLGLIATMFPKARIIHCRRHPLDTILSCWMQNFNDGHSYSGNLMDAARHYAEYQRLMTHWQSVLPVAIHTIDYEAMVEDQEGTTRAMLDYLGLPWDERCLAFQSVSRTVRTASSWQVRQPLYTRSKGRWQNYEPHLDEPRALLRL